ncbi:MAG: ribosomal protein S18-alanine N-acetyltransferase [Paenibacillaceae bacterium]|jgi:ribosomal-protein-alanine N-acetyltransferase|nr:ribosomal protein S18-alanine N-acetyltransferase [Paenibacillaceae bacterium]
MTVHDVPRVTEIERASFAIPWTEQAIRAEMDNKYAVYVVAVDEHDRVCGYAGMWIVCDEAMITNIAVCPRNRGKRLGYALLEELRAQALPHGVRMMTLEVRPSNVAALTIYTRCRFTVVGVRPRYYADNDEDAWMMVCTALEQSFVG